MNTERFLVHSPMSLNGIILNPLAFGVEYCGECGDLVTANQDQINLNRNICKKCQVEIRKEVQVSKRMKKQPFPYFRFSKWADKPDFLSGWFDHFDGKGIPVAIVKSRPGPEYPFRYAIFLIGQEETDGLKPNSEEITGEVVRSHNWPTLEKKAA